MPEIILATTEPPSRLVSKKLSLLFLVHLDVHKLTLIALPLQPVRGPGVFIQARVCRTRPKATGESDALAVSEALPFLEFNLARQLILKLKIKILGRNAAFSLKSKIDVGSQLIIATATATAVGNILNNCSH